MIETGVYFGETHSYYDLNLILSAVDIPPVAPKTSRCPARRPAGFPLFWCAGPPAIPPAAPKTNFVDVPGADGTVDLTEAHGEVKYSDRECSFTFTMLPTDSSTWEEKKTEVSNLLNGRVFKITLDKDDEFYYLGRCQVSGYEVDRKIRQIVVMATVKPYKFKQDVTVMKYALTNTPKSVSLINGRKTVSPSIECTNDDTVIVFGDATFNLSAGTHKVLDIQLKEGNNAVTVSGTGSVTFTYQEGEL